MAKTLKVKDVLPALLKLRPCADAAQWLEEHKDMTARKAFEEAPGEWVQWLTRVMGITDVVAFRAYETRRELAWIEQSRQDWQARLLRRDRVRGVYERWLVARGGENLQEFVRVYEEYRQVYASADEQYETVLKAATAEAVAQSRAAWREYCATIYPQVRAKLQEASREA